MKNYKRNNIILLSGVVIVLILGWRLSFSKSLHAWSENKSLRGELRRSQGVMQEIAALKSQLGEGQEMQAFDENKLFEKVTSLANDNAVEIREMPNAKAYQEGGWKVQMNRILLTGEYFDLLSVVWHLEQDANAMGRVVSLRFSNEINRETREEELICTLYLLNILTQ